VAHHGSGTSSSEEFLRRVNPFRAVISVGVVARLEQVVGVAGVYQTAQQGTIEFISDGRQLWVRTER
jgi:beta-lactamase superfamily II metal-dependent hydrolase